MNFRVVIRHIIKFVFLIWVFLFIALYNRRIFTELLRFVLR